MVTSVGLGTVSHTLHILPHLIFREYYLQMGKQRHIEVQLLVQVIKEVTEPRFKLRKSDFRVWALSVRPPLLMSRQVLEIRLETSESETVSHSVLSSSLLSHGLQPLSIRFSRQEYWGGQPFPSPGDLPSPGIEPGSPALQAVSLPTELQGMSGFLCVLYVYNISIQITLLSNIHNGKILKLYLTFLLSVITLA